MINLEIDFDNRETIEKSFVRIATDLFSNWQLKINNTDFLFTEIEFYLFKEEIHPDKSTHEHQVEKGYWRAHSQGLDISLGFDEETYDGGILIRGLKTLDNQNFINGPRRVITKIFDEFGLSTSQNNGLVLMPKESLPRTIFRTVRTGITENNSPGYSEMKYNFFCDADLWNKKHYSKDIMSKFLNNPEKVNL